MQMVNALLLDETDFIDPNGPKKPGNFKPEVLPLEQDAHVILFGGQIISHRSHDVTRRKAA